MAERSPSGFWAFADAESATRYSSYKRYDIQQAARWIEQLLPFSLLLLVVFIRQHLLGREEVIHFDPNFCGLVSSRGWSLLLVRNGNLLYPLILLPPKYIPPFWHAIFIIMAGSNAAMVLKCSLLIYFKNSRGQNYRKQGQLLTAVEYLMLLYHALFPTPVWYRFFLNKEYGSLFSSLMIGLYLTFKLTSVVEKVQSFLAALKALSHRDVHYGVHATSEQVDLLPGFMQPQSRLVQPETCVLSVWRRCILPYLVANTFCEDCVSEWFEREKTCPLCRALVKPADIRSFSDESTILFSQIF